MNSAEIEQFESNTYYKDALRLRVWDDLAKDPKANTPDVAHFMKYIQESLAS